MISALQSSTAGMMRASARANEAAAALVRAPAEAAPETTSEVAAIIELSAAAHSYKANATVVAATSDMLGKVIDSLS